MLSIFRKGTTSKIMLGFLGLALFAMVVTGFGTGGGGLGDLGGLGGDSVARVGGEAVGTADVTDQLNRQLANAREQQPDLDMGTFLASGAYEEIVNQMISSAALSVFGANQGLAASKRMVDGEIASIPAFQNLAGQFDDTAFRAALRSQNVTEQQVRDDIAGAMIRRQLLLPAAGSPRVPRAMALQYASLLLEQRSGSIGLVSSQAMGAGTEPSDAEIAAFYKSNQTRYTVPEQRVLRYAAFSAEQVAAAAQPTDAEIAAFYNANPGQYGAKETRTLSQVILPDQAAARALAQKVAGGMSFAQAASQAGFSAADTALGARDQAGVTSLSSQAVAQAAFAAAEGATTAPVQSPLGWHVVHVDAIATKAATPLAAVRDEIAGKIRAQKSEQALGALVTRIEDAIGEGSSFEEVARAEKLTIQETPPITATGQSTTPGVRVAPEMGPLLKTGFEMTADEDPVVETIAPGQLFAILAVGRIIPAAPPALAQISTQVKADLVARRAADRAKAVATAIVARINAGTPPARAFAEAKLPLQAPEAVTARRLDIARPNQPVPPPLAMMFSMPKGKARILAAPNGGGWFVVHLAETVAGNAAGTPGLVEATRTQFESIMGEEYASQFTRAVEAEVEVERNAEAIRATKRALQGPGAL